jgi:hypothetical protein
MVGIMMCKEWKREYRSSTLLVDWLHEFDLAYTVIISCLYHSSRSIDPDYFGSTVQVSSAGD